MLLFVLYGGVLEELLVPENKLQRYIFARQSVQHLTLFHQAHGLPDSTTNKRCQPTIHRQQIRDWQNLRGVVSTAFFIVSTSPSKQKSDKYSMLQSKHSRSRLFTCVSHQLQVQPSQPVERRSMSAK